MPSPYDAYNGTKSVCGKRAGSSALSRIEFTSIIDEVSEIEDAGISDTFLAPGLVDLQVNGFAGVDYNDPTVLPC